MTEKCNGACGSANSEYAIHNTTMRMRMAEVRCLDRALDESLGLRHETVVIIMGVSLGFWALNCPQLGLN